MGTWGSRGNKGNNNDNQRSNQNENNNNDSGNDNQSGNNRGNSNSGNNNGSSGKRGFYGGKKNYNDEKNPFTFVTNMFESKSGNSFNVFIKDDEYGNTIINALSSIQVGDMLLVTENRKGGMILSIKRGDQ